MGILFLSASVNTLAPGIAYLNSHVIDVQIFAHCTVWVRRSDKTSRDFWRLRLIFVACRMLLTDNRIRHVSSAYRSGSGSHFGGEGHF